MSSYSWDSFASRHLKANMKYVEYISNEMKQHEDPGYYFIASHPSQKRQKKEKTEQHQVPFMILDIPPWMGIVAFKH